MDVAAGLKMPVIWTLTLQQWVPQVYHTTLYNLLCRCVCVCATFNLALPVYHYPALCFRDDVNQKQILDVSHLVNLVESSFKKPDNTFRWPPTIPAEWFSSVTSSAYWVIILRALLVSCMPGALQSSLDLQWHLTWDTCCRYDGGSMAWSAAEIWQYEEPTVN